MVKIEKCESENVFDMCPFVMAQKILSGKWTVLILEELSTGTKRFSEIQKKI